jgi:hypothetical protein
LACWLPARKAASIFELAAASYGWNWPESCTDHMIPFRLLARDLVAKGHARLNWGVKCSATNFL